MSSDEGPLNTVSSLSNCKRTKTSITIDIDFIDSLSRLISGILSMNSEMVVVESEGNVLISSILVVKRDSIIHVNGSSCDSIWVQICIKSDWSINALRDGKASIMQESWNDCSSLFENSLLKILELNSDWLSSSNNFNVVRIKPYSWSWKCICNLLHLLGFKFIGWGFNLWSN